MYMGTITQHILTKGASIGEWCDTDILKTSKTQCYKNAS